MDSEETVVVKVVEKMYHYSHMHDTVRMTAMSVNFIETSPLEALDLIMETNSTMTEGEQKVQNINKDYVMTTCYATICRRKQ